ncbi:AMP-dependent synthetase/ligase domain-containing protein OS=Streptomyces glaucescens OX=1907 GN=SGLAU_28875 PE=4 SV=1 [Streptomyces glaucescens]
MSPAGTLADDGTERGTAAGTRAASRGSTPSAQAHRGTLDGLFSVMARHRGTAVAVQDEGRGITYGAAERYAAQLATALLRAEVQLGDPVLLHCTDHVQFLVAQLAVLKLGAVCVPVPRDADRAALQRCAEVSGASLVLCGSALRARWELPALVLDDPAVWSRISRRRPEASLPHSGRTDAAHLLVEHADGTGHLVDHRAWMFSLADRTRRVGPPDRAVAVCGRPGAPEALSAAWWAFSAGVTLSSRPGGVPVAPRTTDHATTAVLRPADYATALDAAVPGAPTRLRTVLLVGEPCPGELVRRHLRMLPRTRLLAEFAPLDGAMPWAAVDHSADGVTTSSLAVVGREVSRVRITIRDAEGHPLEDGRTGAVWASGTALPFDRLRTRGRPEGDLPAPASLTKSPYLGRRNECGALEITGIDPACPGDPPH